MSSWNNLAACRGLDIQVFFPDPAIDDEADPARSVCSDCAVQGVCLEAAIDRREKNGVWGGCTERERRRIIRRRRSA